MKQRTKDQSQNQSCACPAGCGSGMERRTFLKTMALGAAADSVSRFPVMAGPFTAADFAQMKPTALFVNTSRGPVVDETALIEALRSQRIAGAALDVFDREPEIDPRLYDCPRLTLAPHIGSATTEARTQMARLCVDGVIAVLSGQRPPNLVNKDVVLG